jgi:hypothetical protein
MTPEIFTHLEDVLNGLQEIKGELDIDANNPEIHHQLIEDLENDVIEPLTHSIDSLQYILESIRKMGDADAFYDPYNEGIE